MVVVAFVSMVLLLDFSIFVLHDFCFLGGGSECAGCGECFASCVGLFRGRLRVVGGGGCCVLVVFSMSLIRWDFRCGLVEV